MTGDAAADRRFARALLLVTLAAAALRLVGLPGQPPLQDDLWVGVSAVNFIERAQIGPTMWQHPRLRDLLVYGSLSALGRSKLALVLPSLLLGLLTVPVIGLLTRRLAGDRAGLLAALLLAVDPVHVDYSRQAVQEAHVAFFGAAGILATLRYVDSRRGAWAPVAGALFGLGLASKWSVVFPLGIGLAWAAHRVVTEPRAPRGERTARLSLVVASLAVLPAAVYVATWAPWFVGGRGLADWLHLHSAMAADATTHAGYDPAAQELPHRAIAWFLRPVFHADAAFGAGEPIALIAITNPLSWLATLPAIAWLGREAHARRASEALLLPVLVLGTWLPFAVASRPIWLHSALAVLPFALAAVAAAATGVAGDGVRARRWLAAYALVTVIVAAPLWLLATGQAMSMPGLREVALSFRPSVTFGPGGPP